jgi:hypothetical protein
MILTTLMMEAVSAYETSVCIYETPQRNILKDRHLHTCRRKYLKSHKILRRRAPAATSPTAVLRVTVYTYCAGVIITDKHCNLHRDVRSCLLGCDTVWTCRRVPTFRRNIPLPSYGLLCCNASLACGQGNAIL